jgi:uncharacterized cupredoxin-like copper-binding protein
MTYRLLSAALLFAVLAPQTALAEEDSESDADRTVTVEATEFEFKPEKIEMEPSTTLKLKLVNEGNVAHSWAVPKLDVESERIQPGKTTSVMLEADEVGTYKIMCQVQGHEAAGMVGKLVVESDD